MPDWIIILIKFAANDLPKALKRHLSQTIVTTIIVTLVFQWLAVGPWGSQKLRKIYLNSILTNDDDKHQAGFFTESDVAILDRWKTSVSAKQYSDDFDTSPSALQLARYQAQHASPPFQPLGTSVTISAPDCRAHRPKYGNAYMNSGRSDLKEQGWKIGQRVRFMSQDGRGEPVVALISDPPFDMPDDIQFYLNREQLKMLRQWEPTARVQVISTNAPISQASDDLTPDIPGVRCPSKSIYGDKVD